MANDPTAALDALIDEHLPKTAKLTAGAGTVLDAIPPEAWSALLQALGPILTALVQRIFSRQPAKTS